MVSAYLTTPKVEKVVKEQGAGLELIEQEVAGVGVEPIQNRSRCSKNSRDRECEWDVLVADPAMGVQALRAELIETGK